MVMRGEVWWYEPPEANPRPHLILTRSEVIPYVSDILAMPATRTHRGIPTEVDVTSDDGMPADCVLTADNLTLITTSYLGERITTLSHERMDAVCEAVALATGC